MGTTSGSAVPLRRSTSRKVSPVWPAPRRYGRLATSARTAGHWPQLRRYGVRVRGKIVTCRSCDQPSRTSTRRSRHSCHRQIDAAHDTGPTAWWGPLHDGDRRRDHGGTVRRFASARGIRRAPANRREPLPPRSVSPTPAKRHECRFGCYLVIRYSLEKKIITTLAQTITPPAHRQRSTMQAGHKQALYHTDSLCFALFAIVIMCRVGPEPPLLPRERVKPMTSVKLRQVARTRNV